MCTLPRVVLGPLRLLTLGAAVAAGGVPADAPALTLAGLGGHYEGGWLNQTFGSTGAGRIDITLSGSDVSVVFDMDGHVFGQVDPPPITLLGTLSGGAMTFASSGLGVFGDLEGSILESDGSFVFLLDTIPGDFITRVDVSGTIFPDGSGNPVISLDYSVLFPGPPGPTNPAAGIFEPTRVIPEPGTVTLLGIGIAAFARVHRRRT